MPTLPGSGGPRRAHSSGPVPGKVTRLVALIVGTLLSLVTPAAAALRVQPPTVLLEGPDATQQLLVSSTSTANPADLTRRVRYQPANPSIVRIDEAGLVEPIAEGTTEILIIHDKEQARIPVVVKGLKAPHPVSFEQQIIPLLTKAGCNSGSCHGKAEGQNGFRLSVFGHDADEDYFALVTEARGRRLFPASPANSLLVSKATGRLPHGGGKKISEGTLAYRRLVRWIAEGRRRHVGDEAPILTLEVEPAVTTLALRGTQQLRVTAVDANGRRRCVTAEAEYESNAPTLAAVDRRGHVASADIPGEAAILVRYLGHVAVSRISLPRPGVQVVRPSEVNFVDRHVWNKLQRLGIPPSNLADDATFLRRVYLDTLGTLPTAREAATFLASTSARKRAELIEQLLNRPEYADYWAMKWADLLRVDRDVLTPSGAVAMTRWLRRQFAENRPYDQFVRDIVTAEGAITSEGPAGFFRVLEKPEVMSRSISQLFLGVRIECAQCHHHPSEKWGQDDYFALAGFFTGVSRKPGSAGEAILAGPGQDLKHPRTGKAIPARALGAAPAITEIRDRRRLLADWMTAPENPFLARAIANRLWAHYFGHGLVEPLDDLRATNPAVNEPLLDELARHLRECKYDLKAWTRTVLNSRAYQLGPQNAANAQDEQNFSHAVPRSLPAEVLLDAICQVTGVPEKFDGWPEGVRAIQLWDNRVPSYFLRLFGRPARTSVCECERSGEPSIAQALHLMNAPEIVSRIHSRRGTARKLSDSAKSPTEIVEELFLTVLARRPTSAEQHVILELFRTAGVNRRSAVEDAMWTLMNTTEFLYNH